MYNYVAQAAYAARWEIREYLIDARRYRELNEFNKYISFIEALNVERGAQVWDEHLRHDAAPVEK